jgi:HPt (histidine-containing phosphotransfer) domain-containing protein
VNDVDRDSSLVTFDPAELLARVDNDRELLLDLVLIFKKEFPGHLRTLREAVESRDGKRVRVAAHTLKGMLSNVAANRAAAAAAHLEQMGRNEEGSGFQESFAAFDSEAMKLLAQLEAYMAEVCP